ncbi:MAG: sialidase family protein, partial [Bacteroidales bacterium]
MKRIFLFALMLTFTVGSMAQLSQYARKYEQKIPRNAVDNAVMNPLQPANSTVNTKAVLEDELGTTRYDLQTNEACQNRFYVYPDGTMGGTWTMGMVETAYTDRGTGYNYFDGTNWGTPPSARIESVRTGWPSYCPWNGNGELVIAHPALGNLALIMNTRPIKGTGTWTQTAAPVAPTGVTGSIWWSRTITNGTNHQNIHVICMSLPTGNGGTVYKGLDGALLYWRSLDAGATWDKIGIQLPGLDSTNYSSFGGDEYAWGTPHGDTIYFVVGGPYSDMYIMKSNDNGDNWTKIPILSNANKKLKPVPAYRAPWASSDGSVACEMGKNGVIHVCSGYGGGEIQSSTEYILINRNGLIYWNTTMPMLRDSLNLDTLDAHGQLLGYYSDGP